MGNISKIFVAEKEEAIITGGAHMEDGIGKCCLVIIWLLMLLKMCFFSISHWTEMGRLALSKRKCVFLPFALKLIG